jgi:NAD(P)-dependent dehydrogenase (short-subunit alcohol dehydrogenase family)
MESDGGTSTTSRVSLANRTVLVVGPPSGVAGAIADASRSSGAIVVLAADNGSGAAVHPELCANIDNESEAEAFLDAVISRFPALDTVIISVTPAEPGRIHELPLEQWRRAVTDPLRGIFRLVRRVTEEFLASGVAGRFVLLVENGEHGRNEIIEGALRSLTRSFAREYGKRDLACNLVLDARPRRACNDSNEALIRPALFLASQAASFVNGETIVAGPTSDRP